MGSYSIGTIAQAIDASTEKDYTQPAQELSILLTDSRQLSIPSKTIFFALLGPRRHGQDFVADLYEKGVRNFVVGKHFDASPYPDANVLKVSSTLDALQDLATFHRSNFDGHVLAVTGSNGKTIVKEWLYDLLKTQVRVYRSPKSYNSQIGVALSLWELHATHDLAIIEAGISKPGEMTKLHAMIQPDYGLITNLGSAHDEGFDSRHDKLVEKLTLFEGVKKLFYCLDHADIDHELQAHPASTHHWGSSATSELRIAQKDIHPHETRVSLQGRDLSATLRLPFSDAASLENVMHAVNFILGCGFDLDQKRVDRLASIPMRMEVLDGPGRSLVLHDAYNFDLTSLKNALQRADELLGSRELVIVLTDMEESGKQAHQLYEEISQIILPYRPKLVFTIGKKIALLSGALSPQHFEDVDDCMDLLKTTNFKNHLILLKGARSYKLERIAYYLQEKTHDTILEVNLEALAHNYRTLSKLTPKSTKTLVMLKADAYGAGANILCKYFESLSADYFGVAYIDEGIALREEGIKTPILVLNPQLRSFEALVAHDLEPELYSFSLLKGFIELCEASDIVDYPVHLNFDTGMRRLGFVEEDLIELKRILEDTVRVQVKSIMSHLASSDDPEDEKFTLNQFRTFDRMCAQLTAGWEHQPLLHILNTHGVINYPDHGLDMVRLGIGLYGHLQTPHVVLQPVHRYKAKISQIKKVSSKDSIGYNRKGQGYDGEKIATVSVGYADGLSRSLGNGHFSLIVRGQKCPIVGNVCMDMCMIDVTHAEAVQENDEVIIFGPENPLSSLSSRAGTIAYEILTSISSRAKRVYVQS